MNKQSIDVHSTPYLPEHIQDIIYDKFVEMSKKEDNTYGITKKNLVLFREKQIRIGRLNKLYAKLFDPTQYGLKSLNLRIGPRGGENQKKNDRYRELSKHEQFTIYIYKQKNKSKPLPPPISTYIQDSLGTTFSLSHKRSNKNAFSLYFVYVVCVDGGERNERRDVKCSDDDLKSNPLTYRSIHDGQKYLVEYKLNLSGDYHPRDRECHPKDDSPPPLDFDIFLRTQLVGLEDRYMVNRAPTLKAGIQDGIWLFFAFAFEFFRLIREKSVNSMIDIHENSSILSDAEKEENMREMMNAISIFEHILRKECDCKNNDIYKRLRNMSVPRGWEDDVYYILRGMMHPVNKRLDLIVNR